MKICVDGIMEEIEAVNEPVASAQPTLEERLEAVEAVLLEQLLRGLQTDV